MEQATCMWMELEENIDPMNRALSVGIITATYVPTYRCRSSSGEGREEGRVVRIISKPGLDVGSEMAFICRSCGEKGEI